jgi:hypothetical protein
MNEPTGYAVGWGTLSLINAALAQCKGRGGLLWWLISSFTGPIATLFLVIMPDPRTSQGEDHRFRLGDFRKQ